MIEFKVDKNELKQIQRDLDKLFPDSDTKLRATLRSALRKSAAPLRTELRNQIEQGLDSDSKTTGQLKKSIGIINGKTKGGRKPAVYVGPRLKGAWSSKDKSGYYMYFLEYGKIGVSPRRMFDKTLAAKGNEVASQLITKLKTIIEKRFAKK